MEVGTKVKWTSQSQSYELKKIGTIIAVIPAGAFLPACLTSEQYASFAKGAGPGLPRNHVSYVVSVPPVKGKAKAKLYWPIASKLKEVTK
jgi:hypothetical protein